MEVPLVVALYLTRENCEWYEYAIYTKLNNLFYSSNFDVVIVTNYPKDVTLKVNNFCRDLKIKFFAGDIFGYFGYSFMDLVKHDYVEEEVKKVEAGEGKKAKEDEPDAKKAKMVRFLTIFYNLMPKRQKW